MPPWLLRWLHNAFLILAAPFLSSRDLQRLEDRLGRQEQAFARRCRARRVRAYIRRSAPPPGEPGTENEHRRQQALLALWHDLHAFQS